MPSDWLYIDTNFPAFTGEESLNDKVSTIQNYLFMLVEQLRYTLHNLDGSNMNAAAAEQYAATLTDPIYARIEDEAGNLAQLAVTAQGIAARVSNAEGSIATLTLTAEQLELQLSNVRGDVATLSVTAQGLAAQISSVEGNVTTLSVTAQGLEAQISGVEGNVTALSATAQGLAARISSAEGNITTLSATANGLATRVSNAEGNITTLTQTVNGFRLSASNGSTSSTLTLTSSGVAVSSATISFSGLVSFTDLSTRGATIINGANITTGLISANRLDLTGAITFSDLSNSVQNDINDAWSMAYNAQNTAWDASDVISGWTYRGTTYIDGAKLMTGTVMASELLGGSVGLLNSSEQMMGELTITGAATASSAIDLTAYGALRLNAERGEIFIESRQLLNTGTYLQLSSDAIIGNGNLVSNDGYNLGASYKRWNAVYAATGTIQTSDLTKKRDIEYGLDRYEALFDRLRPISYLFTDGDSGRRHHGLGAQDVERAMAECGISDMDFAGLIRSPRETGDGFDYALRYAEFVPMCIDQIQKLKARVAKLEEKL